MTNRLARVRENIKEVVGIVIETKLKDPRVEMVTITDVDISPDLRHCKIFFSTLGDKKEHDRALEGLTSAAGFIRGELGRSLKMKYTPELEFHFDKSVEHGARISEILRKIKSEQEG